MVINFQYTHFIVGWNMGVLKITLLILFGRSKIPLKIRIFLWLVKQKKVLTRVNLSKNGWQGYVRCPFCGKSETVDYLSVQCSFAKTIQNWIAKSNDFEFEIGVPKNTIVLLYT